jgi:hypothetical protein
MINKIAKISIFQTGEIRLDNKIISFEELTKELNLLKDHKGVVWYYRENPNAEPPSQALKVIELIINMKIPVKLSSEPDFSDHIDPEGTSHKIY